MHTYVYVCYFVTYDTTFDFVTLWQYLRNLLEDTKFVEISRIGLTNFIEKIRSLVKILRNFVHLATYEVRNSSRIRPLISLSMRAA